jgi:hypothetical protein
LIDLKFPDPVSAVSNYGSGMSAVGVVYDAFAFPLAMVVVSAITSLMLAFWLINKFQKNKALRPERLYLFMRALVFIGGAVMVFSGFVYVVYSWLYGNLPIAVFMKGIVAVVIVGMVALYFYLTGDGKNKNESMIGRLFAVMLVVVTLATLFFSFNVIGTPAEARKYRLDSLTIQNLQTVKQEIDNQDQNYGKKIQNLSEIDADYVKAAIKRTKINYSTTDSEYTLCTDFNSDMPIILNEENRDTTWDYKVGNSCFTFKHLAPYPNAVPQTKPVIVR